MPEAEEKAPEREEYPVTILRRDEITTYAKIGEPVEQVLVTYVAAGLAPATLRFIKEDYTLELEKEKIRAEIERRRARKAEAYKV